MCFLNKYLPSSPQPYVHTATKSNERCSLTTTSQQGVCLLALRPSVATRTHARTYVYTYTYTNTRSRIFGQAKLFVDETLLTR